MKNFGLKEFGYASIPLLLISNEILTIILGVIWGFIGLGLLANNMAKHHLY